MNPLLFPKPLALHHVGSDQIGRARLNGKESETTKWTLYFPHAARSSSCVGRDQLWRGSTQKRKTVNTSYLLIISYSKLSWPKRKWQLSLLYFLVVTCLFVWFNIHLLHFIHPIDAILIFIFFPFIHTIDAIYFL